MRRLFEDTDKKTRCNLVIYTIQTTTILSQQNKGNIGTFKEGTQDLFWSAGFAQFGKKMPHKIYVAASNRAQKEDPRISTIFLKEAFQLR